MLCSAQAHTARPSSMWDAARDERDALFRISRWLRFREDDVQEGFARQVIRSKRNCRRWCVCKAGNAVRYSALFVSASRDGASHSCVFYLAIAVSEGLAAAYFFLLWRIEVRLEQGGGDYRRPTAGWLNPAEESTAWYLALFTATSSPIVLIRAFVLLVTAYANVSLWSGLGPAHLSSWLGMATRSFVDEKFSSMMCTIFGYCLICAVVEIPGPVLMGNAAVRFRAMGR